MYGHLSDKNESLHLEEPQMAMVVSMIISSQSICDAFGAGVEIFSSCKAQL